MKKFPELEDLVLYPCIKVETVSKFPVYLLVALVISYIFSLFILF